MDPFGNLFSFINNDDFKKEEEEVDAEEENKEDDEEGTVEEDNEATGGCCSAPSGRPRCRIGHTSSLAQMQFCCSFKTRSISSFSVSLLAAPFCQNTSSNFYIEHRPLESKIINFRSYLGKYMLDLDFIRQYVRLIFDLF